MIGASVLLIPEDFHRRRRLNFDTWVKDGLMPEGKRVRGVMLWDAERVRAAWQALIDQDDSKKDDGVNPFDQMVV